MLERPNAIEDRLASQDAKTLVPLSLSLVVKKKEMLQIETTKLEKLLSQRNEILCGLQESHEYLLTTNGKLQERSRLRREKLVSMRTTLEEHRVDDRPSLCDSIGVNELKATAEKCGLLKDVLSGLESKRTGLEQQCMGLEEQTARERAALKAKEERLGEVQSSICLLHEDINATQWNIAGDQDELADANEHLDSISQIALCQTSLINELEVALKTKNAAVGALWTVWQNYDSMVHEEHLQLVIANDNARSEQRELQKLLRDNGATCPADEKVLQAANDHRLRLQKLEEHVKSVKLMKRELFLRRKQEKDVLTITQSSIKAKDDQLTWLNRQCVHLKSERNEASKAYSANEAALSAFRKEHNVAMANLDMQIKDAEKQLKTTERAIATRNKKMAALSKKKLQKIKVFQEWQAKVKVKQDKVAQFAATKELVDAEVSSLQEKLEQVQRQGEQFQHQSTTQKMESLKLQKSCAALEAELQHMHTTLSGMNTSYASVQTVVKNRIDEIRDKFLNTFVVDDSKILIKLLDNEINGWIKKDTDEVNRTIACETLKLKERYEILAAETRKNFGMIMKQKEKNYDTKIEKLKKMREDHANQAAGKGEKATLAHQIDESATGHDKKIEPKELTTSEDKCSKAQNRRLIPSPINEAIIRNASSAKRRSVNAHSTHRKAKGVSKLALKSARRQLAPGLNMVDNLPQINKETTDVFDVDTAAAHLREAVEQKVAKSAHLSILQKSRLSNKTSGARRPRLKRRTQAQKTGKPAIASITPETALHVDNICDTISTHDISAIEKSKQYLSDSPISCDDDLGVSNRASNTDGAKETSSNASQGATKKLPAQRVGHRSKGSSKRRMSTKRSKLSRISVGRSQPSVHNVDWLTADTFSFN